MTYEVTPSPAYVSTTIVMDAIAYGTLSRSRCSSKKRLNQLGRIRRSTHLEAGRVTKYDSSATYSGATAIASGQVHDMGRSLRP